jgi:hypothetical protein
VGWFEAFGIIHALDTARPLEGDRAGDHRPGEGTAARLIDGDDGPDLLVGQALFELFGSQRSAQDGVESAEKRELEAGIRAHGPTVPGGTAAVKWKTAT